MAEKEAVFEARPYQVELYEKALLSNSIIYLPTGSGKTYIAVMLIKTMSKSIRRPYSEGGKRTIFAVNTVPLVHQQCEYIGRLTDLECQGYSGDQGVDFWSGDMWQQQFEKYQVLVMTSQIFLDILSHGYMSIDRVNLIIFDECHRAVGDHSMRRIMKFFEDCPDYKQPRILGTSATLLNSNVKLEKVPDVVHDLEITFHAKIITVDSLEPIKGYGKPKEECVVYRQCRIMNPRINTMLEYMKQLLDKIELKEIGRNEETSKEFQPKGRTQKLKNIIEDAQEQLNMHDLYGGSIALLQHMLQFEKLKKSIDQAETLLIFMWLSTGMLSLRKMIADEMNQADLTDYEKFLKYSSDKVIKLLEILRMYYVAQSSKNEEKKFCAIVFVRRRFTAKVLYSLLKVAAKLERRFCFIKPDYVVGSSINPYRNSCEDICITKWNKEALLRFRKGDSNCLIATDVLDEGVDIPICSLVIRYDLPNDFRAYVQSKGRARSSKSNYVMMIGSNDEAAEKTRHRHYQQTELVMRNYLIGKTDSRELPLPEEMQDSLYATEIRPYVVVDSDGVKYTISDVDAIQLIHRYCTSLSNSKFVHCVPTIKLIKHEDEDSSTQKIKYQVLIQMPITSPLREDIFGDKMPTINLAKRSAALKACIRLHQLGELNDKLLPRSMKEFVEDVNNLMANWREEDVEKKYLIGTYGNVRAHNLVYPQDFTDAFPEPGKQSYLHILKVVPTYQKPFESQRHREQVFYDILNDQAGFAILTNKKMSEIPGFPLFMSVGSLDVDLKVNHSTVILTADEIEKLRNFHWVIFEKVLGVIKSFVARQADPHSENQFLIVPVNKEWTIDWSVVTSNQDLNEVAFSAGCSGNAPATTSLSIMSYNQPTTVSNHSYDDWELVRPNYRETCYVVTKVCYEMSPFSTFPTDDFIHYSHYYSVKHQKEITVRDQPLLEVKAISSNIDCTKPRGKSASAKRRDRDNFEEHLIPELCFKITFPRMYWLKATYLPSLLHRMSQLLIAEDLRKKIAEGAGLGVVGISSGTWESLKIPENNEASSKSIDDDALEEGEEDMDIIDELETDISPDNQLEIFMNPPDAEQVETIPEVDFLALESNVYNWSKEKEPMDLERNIENIQLIDIEYYHRFLNNRSLTAEIVTEKYERPVFAKRPNIPTPTLRVIDHQDNTKKALLSGPSPVNIMYALTTKISQDIFNLERLETLGDSYLKYIVSAYLFERYPFYNEGRLTAYKGQIVGNRHLYYCGEAINLPGSLKNEYFEPKCNFLPPCFSVPKYIKNLVKIMNKMPNVLYEIDISRKERKGGQLSDETMDAARSTIASWTDNYGVIHTGTEPYLGQQIIKDKTVSDSVEALIGVYLQSMGIHAATKVIKFLGIIPSDTNIDDILVGKPASAAIGNGDPNFHMPWADAIENILGYQFKDRSFLLQAYTHPSYSNNNITGDYQRLEFLGDAIIDFLITVYIYENCGELSPGELTDLRSALVNNIIFACLTVKYGLHTGLLAFSPNLTDAIDKFVKFQEEKDFSVGDDLHWILLEEEECCMAEYVEVPKMLGDIFESIIGAIYLDTNKNLAKVWEILYCLMHEEIHKFSKNIPKDPVRLIHETQGARPEFKKAEVVDGTNTIMISLVVVLGGKKKLFYGFGATKKQAKRAASKQALKYFHRTLQG